MKTAVVNSSQLATFGRWDAEFLIEVQRLQPKADALAETLKEADVIAVLLAMETAELRCLSSLNRGQGTPGRADLLRVAQEYPFLAYAMVLEHLDAAVARVESEAQKALAYAERLRTLPR